MRFDAGVPVRDISSMDMLGSLQPRMHNILQRFMDGRHILLLTQFDVPSTSDFRTAERWLCCPKHAGLKHAGLILLYRLPSLTVGFGSMRVRH